jgi:hypothetical protein
MMTCTLPSDQSSVFQAQIEALSDYVHQSVNGDDGLHEVESVIWSHLLAIGRSALGLYLSLEGDGDAGETIVLKAGKMVSRLAAKQSRDYQSVFGRYRLERYVYGTRVGQKIEHVPLDSRLQLPESQFSYLLQDWDQSLAVESPYAQVNKTLSRILGFSQSVDSLERMNRQMSQSVAAFEQQRPAVDEATPGQVIVASADGKGVPIRHQADSPTIAGHRPNRGPKPNRKKMAIVGAAYNIEPRIRTPQSVLDSLFREPHTTPREKDSVRPQAKRVQAKLTLATEPDSPNATDQIFGWLTRQLQQRQSATPVPVVLLMDGQPSLWQTAAHTLGTDCIQVLDLLHVTSRVWRVAALWRLPSFDATLCAVKAFISLILNGQVKDLMVVWRLLADTGTLTKKKQKLLDSVCRYFENNLHRMRYDQFLAAGYPIASGVIEGACRHVVKDRMERAGMQWSMVGAQAMLDIRTVALNDDWTAFNNFRIQHENLRLYPDRDPMKSSTSAFIA